MNMIQLNVTTLTELTYLFGRDMATRRSGHILLVASLLAFQAIPSQPPRPCCVSAVAASGIRALLQGKAMAVAGLSNKMAAFSKRLTPRSMQRATKE